MSDYFYSLEMLIEDHYMVWDDGEWNGYSYRIIVNNIKDENNQ